MGIGDRIIIGVDRVVNAFCVLVGILVLPISCYSLLDNYWQLKGDTDDSLLAYRPSLDHPLDPNRLISPEQMAWLVMDDTTIDYPVMQAGDNIKYLNTDPYGEYRMTGSISLDYRNAPDFSDGYSLIYGHHMVSGAMFGALDGYRDRAYFDAHRTGRLVTCDAVYAVHTFAVAHSSVASDSAMFSLHGRSPGEVLSHLEQTAQYYVSPAEGQRIIALSTCSYDRFEDRLMVFVTLEELPTRQEWG